MLPSTNKQIFLFFVGTIIHVIEISRVIKRFPKQKSNEFKFNTSHVWFISFAGQVRWEVVRCRFAKNHGFVMTKESGAQTIRYRLVQRSKKTSLCAPFLSKSPKKTKNGVPGAGNQWCQPQISKFLRFIISTARIATKIVTELCTQSATHSYAKVMTGNDQGKHRGLAGPMHAVFFARVAM